ncbi:MAG: GNAT family acetyltransferase [Candidatus Berkiella sp.]
MTELTIQRFKGNQAFPYIDNLAELRIKVFREYPYLYDGKLDYEKKYLSTYANCQESVLVVVKDGEEVVGVSSAIPLEFETPECQQPFIDNQLSIDHIFYFGESVLLPQYRGTGVYRSFFHERENAARQYGSQMAAFCAVSRPDDDPRCPSDYTPLDGIWQHFGYQQHPELRAFYEWKEIDSDKATSKPMIFWTKSL